MSIQLEVGKTYVTRAGAEVTVEKNGDAVLSMNPYTFKGTPSNEFVPRSWTVSGVHDLDWEARHNDPDPLDLVAEAPTEGAVDKATLRDDVLDAAAYTTGVEAEPPSRGLFGALDVLLNRKETSDRSTAPVNAEGFLRDAAETMAERGNQYDSPQGERSMGKTVQAFNTITGQDLTEAQGWLFMSVLKKVRQYQAGAHLDSCVDDVAYTALFAEARMQEKQS